MRTPDAIGGPAPDPDLERRLTTALEAAAGQVRPDPDGWPRIEERLDGAAPPAAGGSRRPLLVAAVAVLALVAGVLVAARAGTGGELQVAVAPAAPDPLAVVALTEDDRLVELATDGSERRELARLGPSADHRYGTLAVSPTDQVVYVARHRAGSCGERSGDTELVAVPLAGGEPVVVAPIGAAPTVEPRTGRLAYLGSADETCGDPVAGRPVVRVLDPATGATATVDPTTVVGGTATAVLLQPVWSADGTALYSLVAYGSGRPLLGLVRTEVAASGAGLTLGPPELRLATADADPLAGTPLDDPAAGRTVAAAPLDASEGESLALLTSRSDPPAISLVAVDLRIDPDTVGTVVATETVTSFDPATVASASLQPVGLDVDRATGRALVVALAGPGAVGEPEGPDGGGSGADAATGIAVVLGPDGVEGVLDHVVAAAWLRTGGDASEATPSSPSPPTPGPGSVPPGPVPSPAAPPAGSPEPPPGSTEHQIRQAYRDLFEAGDRSALEGSGLLEPALQEGAATVADGGRGVTVVFDSVTVTGPTDAAVAVRLYQGPDAVTAPVPGHAVLVDGRWKVSASTMCLLLARVGIDCPAP